MSPADRATRAIFRKGFLYGVAHALPVHARQYLSDRLEAAWCAGFYAARMVHASD